MHKHVPVHEETRKVVLDVYDAFYMLIKMMCSDWPSFMNGVRLFAYAQFMCNPRLSVQSWDFRKLIRRIMLSFRASRSPRSIPTSCDSVVSSPG